MSIKSHLQDFSDLVKDYNILIFLFLIVFGWLLAWFSIILFAVFFAK